MIRTRTHVALACIALLLVAPFPPPGGAPAVGTAAAAEHAFVLEQGDRCYEVSPLRGDEDVASFYDYRNPGNHDGPGEHTYSSFMPEHLTRADASRLFLYEGPGGVSLVVVHNARGEVRDAGSAATFRFDGLPADGEWVVEDDGYDGRDDRFSRTRIDWSWYGERTDGGAFRGLDRGDAEVTVGPAFDEAAALYDEPVDRQGSTEAWEFLTGSLGSPDAVSLDMATPVTIRTGHCGPDETPPSAALVGEDGVAGVPVTLDAGGSTDDRGIEAYRWDLDDDGEAERATDAATVEHAYDEPGTYNVSVTVVDGGDNADEARARVTVEPDEPPTAEFVVGEGGDGDDGGGDGGDGDDPEGPIAGVPVTLDASDSTDDVGIAAYRWDLDGDGEGERETGAATVAHTFADPGRYDVSLTVVDTGGGTDTATRTVAVAEDEPPDPRFRVVTDEPLVVGDEVTFSAANSSDDTGIAEYRWSFGDDANATGERVAHAYDEAGTYAVTLAVVDEGGNDATTTRSVEILPPDETPPDAAVETNPTAGGGPISVEAGVPVGFDATGSSDDRSIAGYEWSFGDGATAGGPDAATASHAYDAAGNYTVTVVVTDGGGNADAANVTVRVRPARPPAVSAAVPGTVVAGEQFRVEGSASDESGVATRRWSFGDGATATGADATHAYGSAGNYTVTFTAVDAGGHANATTSEVEVLPRDETPPSAALSVGDNGTTTGESVRFDASGSTDGETGVREYRWDLDGDDAVERRTDNATVTHSYASPGTYDATVVVADREDNTDAATVAVTVERDERAHPGGGDDDDSDEETGGGIGAGGGGGGGGGSTAVGPPPVSTEVERPGPDSVAVDVGNARADDPVSIDLPATEAADATGVRFRGVTLALARDDPHFVVETARGSDPSADALPADASLGALAASAKYLDAGTVESVTYEVAVERSRLADALALGDGTGAAASSVATSLAPADLRAYERAGGAWEHANLTVVERGETVVLRVRTDDITTVALGADLPAVVTDATLAEREVAADEPVAATATVRNPGDDAETVAVNLTADGEVVGAESVEVAGNATRNVTLAADLSPGEHAIAVAGADLGTVTVSDPAPNLSVAAVSVNESTVRTGEPVAITAAVENAGGVPGERTVALTLFGDRVATETVSVPAGEAREVTFVRAIDAPGRYTAKVGNERAAIEVEGTGAATTRSDDPAGPSVPIPGFGVGAALAALAAAALVAARVRSGADG